MFSTVLVQWTVQIFSWVLEEWLAGESCLSVGLSASAEGARVDVPQAPRRFAIRAINTRDVRA